MNLATRKLLGVGLISLGASFSSATITNTRGGIHAPADRNNGNWGCGDGEQYMQIKTARSLPWFDDYTITWRQLTDACRSPVVNGFEATGYFEAAARGDKGEDGSPQLSIDMCAPYGYYELEIKIEGDHDDSEDIHWRIDAASNKNLTVTKWSGKADVSKPAVQSMYVWPVKNEAGIQLEKMWSGPEPHVCTYTSKGDLTLEEPGLTLDLSNEVIPGTFDEGCYDYVDNEDILMVIGPPSYGMTKQKCIARCLKHGYGYSATANGQNCLCGDMPPSRKRALDYCDVPCPGDLRFMCGGNRNNWYLSIVRILQTPEVPDAAMRRSLLEVVVDAAEARKEAQAKKEAKEEAEAELEAAKEALEEAKDDEAELENAADIARGLADTAMTTATTATGAADDAEAEAMDAKVTAETSAAAVVTLTETSTTAAGAYTELAESAGELTLEAMAATEKAADQKETADGLKALSLVAVSNAVMGTMDAIDAAELDAEADAAVDQAIEAVNDALTLTMDAATVESNAAQALTTLVKAWNDVVVAQGVADTDQMDYETKAGTALGLRDNANDAIEDKDELVDAANLAEEAESDAEEEVKHLEQEVEAAQAKFDAAVNASNEADDKADAAATAEAEAEAAALLPMYKGCFRVEDNAGIFTKHVECRHEMSNKVCQSECEFLGYWYSATTQSTECYCGDKAPVKRKDDYFCYLYCEDGSSDYCGGWEYFTVYKTPEPVEDMSPSTPSLPTEPDVGATYEGCYDVEDNSDIFKKFVKNSEWMTNEDCQSECRKISYWYSATTEGTACYCGDQAPVKRQDIWFCRLPCEDDTEIACGGWGYFTVFRINNLSPSWPPSTSWPPTKTDGDVTYKGCYHVDDNSDTFNKLVKKSEWMTNEVCQSKCRDINYWYSATTEGTDCYCGDKAPVREKEDWHCKLPCEDGADIKCGGWGYITVFQIHEPVSSVPPSTSWPTTKTDGGVTYKGCYGVDNNSGIFNKLVKSSQWMTNEVCQSKCRDINYWYSATTEGTDCYCGEAAPVREQEDWHCKLPCEDDADIKCGGWGYITVFQISEPGSSVPPSTSWPPTKTDSGVTYKGCYGVDDNSGTFNKLVKSSQWMTNEVCQSKCRDINYWYSATTEGTDCYCGEAAPVREQEDWHCKLPCEDGAEIKCGGWGYITVFQISEPGSSVPPSTSWPPTKTDGDVTYKGCYGVDDNSDIFNKFAKSSQWMTNKVCQNECREIDYWYSATTEGTDCYCGDRPPFHERDGWHCDYPCEDSSDIKCGGWGFITVFEILKPDIRGPLPAPVPKERPSLTYGEVEGAYAKGCFEDSKHSRVLGGHSFDSDSMTAQKCGHVCKQKNYKVFGVEFGRECFCGDRVPSGGRDADECDKRCTGSDTEVCGGHSRINIYEFAGGYESASSDRGHPSLKDDEVEGAQALGCYEDDNNNRVLDEHSFVDKTGMTAEVCGHACYKKGFNVFGTEFGRECFCGKNVPESDWQADKCDSACTGNEWVACGGRNRINIFKWVSGYGGNEPDSGPDYDNDGMLHQDTYDGATYLGCYEDSKKHRVLDEDSKVDHYMTTQACGDYCKGNGYVYFGTEYSTECFCGNSFYEDKVYDSECNRPCEGKKSTICGGHNRISLYECDYHSPYDDYVMVEPKPEHMLGCFKDSSSHRVLNLKAEYKLDDMTPEKCYWYCKAVHGAMYYGVEYGKECFCGNRESKYYEHPLDESSCKMPCPGDKKKYCGGSHAINVYGPRSRH